jgi:hypothetical protein
MNRVIIIFKTEKISKHMLSNKFGNVADIFLFSIFDFPSSEVLEASVPEQQIKIMYMKKIKNH